MSEEEIKNLTNQYSENTQPGDKSFIFYQSGDYYSFTITGMSKADIQAAFFCNFAKDIRP